MDSGGGASRGGRSGRSLVGEVFGRLTVVADAGVRDKSGAIKWLCLCSCGNTTHAVGASLKRGDYRSCGCWTKDRMRNAPPAKKHGGVGSGAYKSWATMKRRCLDTGFKDYPQYGGRGITVCERWLQSFANFLADMGERPAGRTLDRKNSNGDYEPDNCRWATRLTQAGNTGRNHLLTYCGATHTLADWARITGIPYSRLRARINVLHWPVWQALEKEKENGKNCEDRENRSTRVRIRPGMSSPSCIRIKRIRKP